MNDRQDHLNELTAVMREDQDSIPYLLGYLSAYLPTENLHNAIQSYTAHLVALSAYRQARELALANEQLAQE